MTRSVRDGREHDEWAICMPRPSVWFDATSGHRRTRLPSSKRAPWPRIEPG
jgi:hypothetical protein